MKEQLKKLIIKILSICIILFIILNFVIGITIVHTNDNFPSIKDGDLVIYWRLGDFYTGDIVSYEYDGESYIGRIVGVSGDEINFSESGYTLNNTVPYETNWYETKPTDTIVYPYKIIDGYFIMNDYRENVNDSREWGAIPKVKGKIVLVLRGRGI